MQDAARLGIARSDALDENGLASLSERARRTCHRRADEPDHGAARAARGRTAVVVRAGGAGDIAVLERLDHGRSDTQDEQEEREPDERMTHRAQSTRSRRLMFRSTARCGSADDAVPRWGGSPELSQSRNEEADDYRSLVVPRRHVIPGGNALSYARR